MCCYFFFILTILGLHIRRLSSIKKNAVVLITFIGSPFGVCSFTQEVVLYVVLVTEGAVQGAA